MSISKKLKLNQTSNQEHGEKDYEIDDSLTFSHFFTHPKTASTVHIRPSYLQSHGNSNNSCTTQIGAYNSTSSHCEKYENESHDYKAAITYQDFMSKNMEYQNDSHRCQSTIAEQEKYSENHNDATIREIDSMKPMQSHFGNSYTLNDSFQYSRNDHEVPLVYQDLENQHYTPSYFENLANNCDTIFECQKYKSHVTTSQNIEQIQSISCNNNQNDQGVANPEYNYSLPTKFLHLIDELNDNLQSFSFPDEVKCVYNSTIYARHTFEMYVRKYCSNPKPILFFGMNPGPWGMSQTGVPFGEVNSVRDWLKIEGPVLKPSYELPMRPVLGFNCRRSEISGKRFWGLWKQLCIVPDNFFRTSFVYNYLPQQWMTESGCNKTPSDFKADEMSALYDICDPIFCKVLELYQVKTIVAIGRFCESRAKRAIKRYSEPGIYKVIFVPHPSPRTANSNNWNEKMIGFLEENDLLKYYKPNPQQIVSGVT